VLLKPSKGEGEENWGEGGKESRTLQACYLKLLVKGGTKNSRSSRSDPLKIRSHDKEGVKRSVNPEYEKNSRLEGEASQTDATG